MSYYNGYSVNPVTGITTFYGETLADLALMPTTTKEGEGKYKYGFAAEGSYARILTADDLSIYMLRSTGWIDVTNVVGGGGGGDLPPGTEMATDEDIENLFNTTGGNSSNNTGNNGNTTLPDGSELATDDDINNLFP